MRVFKDTVLEDFLEILKIIEIFCVTVIFNLNDLFFIKNFQKKSLFDVTVNFNLNLSTKKYVATKISLYKIKV